VQLLNSISATRFQRNIAITVNPVAEFEGEIPNEIAEYGRNFCPQLYTGLAQYDVLELLFNSSFPTDSFHSPYFM
jgi:hypothetical protein